MSSSPGLDPLELWRQALANFESALNSAAGRAAESSEVNRALQQVSGVSRGLQQVFDKSLAGTYRRLHLASRSDVQALAETLQRMEAKLDQLLTAQVVPHAVPQAPRPARTRRPPPEAAAPVVATSKPRRSRGSKA